MNNRMLQATKTRAPCAICGAVACDGHGDIVKKGGQAACLLLHRRGRGAVERGLAAPGRPQQSVVRGRLLGWRWSLRQLVLQGRLIARLARPFPRQQLLLLQLRL